MSVKILFVFYIYENHDIAIAMSPSRADPVLHCTGWVYLHVYIRVTALSGAI